MVQTSDGGGGAIPSVILGTIAQANTILGAGLMLLATYRAAREAWKAAHPAADSPFKEDAELIDLLKSDSAGLVTHADEVLAKHSPAAPVE